MPLPHLDLCTIEEIGLILAMLRLPPLQAVKALDLLDIVDMPEAQTQQDRLNFLNTLVDVSREQQIAALGALLFVLQRVGGCCAVQGQARADPDLRQQTAIPGGLHVGSRPGTSDT